MYSEILRYMGHKGEADVKMKELIFSCLKKIKAASTPRHVMRQVTCTVEKEVVKLNTVTINSSALASHLADSAQAYIITATLGTEVDRTISQRSIVDSLEALCLQACAAAKIEEYCDNIEKELALNAEKEGLYITSRFSPGYGDFNIEYQQDILRLLNAQKRIGVTETKSHMLSPLKTVTAVIGIKTLRSSVSSVVNNKCDNCTKIDCQFRELKGNCRD